MGKHFVGWVLFYQFNTVAVGIHFVVQYLLNIYLLHKAKQQCYIIYFFCVYFYFCHIDRSINLIYTLCNKNKRKIKFKYILPSQNLAVKNDIMKKWTLQDRYNNTIYLTEERWLYILESRPELELLFDNFLDTIRTGQRKQEALIPNEYHYFKQFDELLPENNHLVTVVIFKTQLDKTGR